MHGNYLKPSLRRAGLDPDNLPDSDPSKMDFSGGAAKAWKDIWGSGQGIGAVRAVVPAAELVARLDAANTAPPAPAWRSDQLSPSFGLNPIATPFMQ